MPKLISESVRQQVIKIATQQGFVAQLKDNGDDQYVKNLMFYSKPLNQFVYIRKDRAVGAGGVPAYFQVALHPNFFNKSWASLTDGIQEHINSQKKKNLHSSSNYKKFPVFPENDEPCGMCFKVADVDALEKLFSMTCSLRGIRCSTLVTRTTPNGTHSANSTGFTSKLRFARLCMLSSWLALPC